VTQQNSALVEENAATAKTLEQQSKAMNDEVSVFRVDESEAVAHTSPAASAAKVVQAKPAQPKAEAKGAKPIVSSRGNGSGNGTAATVRRGPVGRMQAALATAVNDPEWKEF